jgi:hypothetical protein
MWRGLSSRSPYLFPSPEQVHVSEAVKLASMIRLIRVWTSAFIILWNEAVLGIWKSLLCFHCSFANAATTTSKEPCM